MLKKHTPSITGDETQGHLSDLKSGLKMSDEQEFPLSCEQTTFSFSDGDHTVGK